MKSKHRSNCPAPSDILGPEKTSHWLPSQRQSRVKQLICQAIGLGISRSACLMCEWRGLDGRSCKLRKFLCPSWTWLGLRSRNWDYRSPAYGFDGQFSYVPCQAPGPKGDALASKARFDSRMLARRESEQASPCTKRIWSDLIAIGYSVGNMAFGTARTRYITFVQVERATLLEYALREAVYLNRLRNVPFPTRSTFQAVQNLVIASDEDLFKGIGWLH